MASAESGSRVSFLVVGDYGRGNTDQRTVADGMRKFAMSPPVGFDQPSFVLTTGDNFYGEGLSSDSMFDDRWVSMYSGPVLGDLPWYITLGNHDHYNKSSPAAQLAHGNSTSGADARWVFPDVWYERSVPLTSPTGEVRHIHLVAIDTDILVTNEGGRAEEQWAFIESALQRTAVGGHPIALRVVFGHHPVLTATYRCFAPDVLALKKRLVPLLLASNAVVSTLHLAGHDHAMMAFRVDASALGQPATGNQLVSVVSGGGAGHLYPINCLEQVQSDTLYAASATGFAAVQVSLAADGAASYEARIIAPDGSTTMWSSAVRVVNTFRALSPVGSLVIMCVALAVSAVVLWRSGSQSAGYSHL